MAKVYEALQRAEEERKRRAGGQAGSAPPIQWSEADGGPSRRERAPFWKRWLPRNRTALPDPDGPAEFNKRRISLLQPDSFVAEQFRTLRARIDSMAAQRPIRSLAVTSADAGDGKSTAAINLGIVTSMSVGKQTLLVDCDLRRPQIHRSLGLDPRVGLAEILLDEASLDDAILKVEGMNLEVVAVRGQPSNPSELLSSERMRTLIEEMTERYDRVLFDTPATLGLPDSKAVCEMCDGFVLVVREGVTPRQDVEATLEILERKRLLGVVLNGAEGSRTGYSYY